MDRTNLNSTALSLNVVRLRLGGKLGGQAVVGRARIAEFDEEAALYPACEAKLGKNRKMRL